jgi:hypothetical protein
MPKAVPGTAFEPPANAAAVPERCQAPGGTRFALAIWFAALAVLVAFRVGLPLVVRANAGSSLPLLPRYDDIPLNGDANGYYEAVSNIIDSYENVIRPHAWLFALAVIALLGLAAGVVVIRPRLRWAALVGAALGISLVVTYVVQDVAAPGAPVIGWPLLWAASLWRGGPDWRELTVNSAFPYALALQLAANAVTTVAIAYLGLYATGKRAVGFVAAALYATWPVWVGFVAGEQAWENGQWQVDVGLHLYTEPVSTALVVSSAVLLLRPALGATGAAGAGLALGYAVVVKLTNGLIAAAFLPLVAVQYGLRRTVPYVASCLVSLPLLIAYWPKGYASIYGGSFAPVDDPWRFAYLRGNWEHSTIFTPTMIVLLLVPAIAGAFVVRGWHTRALLGLPIVVTVVTYSFYYVTYLHPRFLFVALPFVFVLAAAGIVEAVGSAWTAGASFGAPAERQQA